MLKIKDNVDLKELEKFGFKKCITNEYALFNECCGMIIDIHNDNYIEISGENLAFDILYDLIKADMVEKV